MTDNTGIAATSVASSSGGGDYIIEEMDDDDVEEEFYEEEEIIDDEEEEEPMEEIIEEEEEEVVVEQSDDSDSPTSSGGSGTTAWEPELAEQLQVTVTDATALLQIAKNELRIKQHDYPPDQKTEAFDRCRVLALEFGFETVPQQSPSSSPAAAVSSTSPPRQSQDDDDDDGQDERGESQPLPPPPAPLPTATKKSKNGNDDDNNVVKVQRTTFPSSTLLFVLGVCIVLVTAGIVTGVSIAGREPKVLDPLPVPTISPAPTAPGETPAPTAVQPTASPSQFPTVSPETFLDLFATVVGDDDDVFQEGTAAYEAAQWMLTQDPSNESLHFQQKSEEAWVQRYLLVYLYYATTDNRSTEWLSCNPPIFAGSQTTDCIWSKPTEIVSGRLVYDRVPSNRWLSAADECDWAGVECQTVSDVVSGGRLAVTSLSVAGQELVGSIVTELVQLPYLQSLDMSHNNLAGQLDSVWKGLRQLQLQYNFLTGSIPEDFFDNESIMQHLNIGANDMVGTIPAEVGLASQMTALYVFDNAFQGTIPILGNMPLRIFQGQQNQLGGILPFDLHYGAWAETIEEWWAFDNQLNGPLSENLGLFPSLRDFRVGGNQFTGTIPTSTYQLQNLFRLEVNDNLLTGPIDPSIRGLVKLETFDASGNGLTGTLPDEIAQIQTLEVVKTQNNLLEGVIPTDLCFLGSMEVLEADCLPEDNPPTDCFCCTTCCERGTDNCIQY